MATATSTQPATSKTPLATVGVQEAQAEAGIRLEADRQRRVAIQDARLSDLRAPFPPEAIGKLPRSTCKACSESQRKRCEQHQWVSRCEVCNGSHSSATMHLDFVGHADVTDRLLSVDPGWTWAPAMLDQYGQPSIASSMDRDGNLWINLTVLGVTRPGVGDGKNAKEKIGDALRNAAMRFGVALDLWAKGDREWAHAEKDGTDRHPDEAQPTAQQSDPPPRTETPDQAALRAELDALSPVVADMVRERWPCPGRGPGDLQPGEITQVRAIVELAVAEHAKAGEPA